MRLLFEIDQKDYDPRGRATARPSARGIVIRDGKVAMIHEVKYHLYSFPGGGIQPGEEMASAMIREFLEETGLTVDPASVREYGLVRIIKKDSFVPGAHFTQENYFFLCSVQEDAVLKPQQLEDYEADYGYTLAWVTPEEVLRVNEAFLKDPSEHAYVRRDCIVMKKLMEEGYFQEENR